MTKTAPEESLINSCLARIEIKLGWGDSINWSQDDFEKLSEIIQDKTGVALSITTLKRIWGKVKYENNPTVTTLNTLAKFSGFESWRVFVQHESQQVVSIVQSVAQQPEIRTAKPGIIPQARKRKFNMLVPGIIVGLLLVTLFSFYLINHAPKKKTFVDPSKFNFSVNKIITEGVPNSVIFNYDAAAAPSDSVFIVQTWDISRKKLVPKNKNEYSSIYYYPGYFRTKLIIDSQVVKEHDLMITTDGWLALIEQSPVPMYFSKNEYIKDSLVEVTTANIESHNISMEPKTPQLRFFNMRDMGELKNDNFSFETTIKSDFHKGSAACQYVQVLIQCKDDIIIIPLCAKACVGDLSLYFAGKQVTSKEADLSKFGSNLSEWTTLRVESKNRNVHLYINNQEAYTLTFNHAPTGIVGLQYRFEGTGAVKDTKFSDGKNVYVF